MTELTEPCRLWTGSTNRGYGATWHGGRMVKVHRLTWEEAYGPIPPGKMVCHHCDTPLCYEITHLFLGTQLDNMRDAAVKGRTTLGSRNRHARLSADQIAAIRSEGRPGLHGNIVRLAETYGVSRGHITRIVNGQRWPIEQEAERDDWI
jgi:hypothetical protein